jgi:AcrR family transcriptional regulator
MANKTAERILVTALALFNDNGESGVTSVDIAMEMEISPGNLYYHFKGKETIVGALCQWHHQQLSTLLATDVLRKVSGEEFFYFLIMIMEKLQLFRFLYRSPADLASKYPSADRQRKKTLHLLESSIRLLLRNCADQGVLSASAAEQGLLVELVTLVMTQSFQYEQLKQHKMNEQAQLYHALSVLMTALLPRFSLNAATIAQLNLALERHTVANIPKQ